MRQADFIYGSFKIHEVAQGGILGIVKAVFVFFLIVGVLFCPALAHSAEEIRFDFEGSREAWQIPDWAYYQSDHKAKDIEISSEESSSGKSSLEVSCDFPGDIWAAALVEVQKEMDISEYNTISVDIYLPKDAPSGLLAARLILTVGDGWHFIEMKEPAVLKPGKWVTVSAELDKGGEGRTAWKGRKHKRLYLHLDKIKKIAVRVEYDVAPPHRIGPRYNGPIYMDNLVIE